MSTILAIETSSDVASVALLHGDQPAIARESAGMQTHSQTVLPMVQSLLAVAGIALSRCDAIAFGVGPGSFTGVRTACGIAQGLAFGLDLPVVPVVTLEAMAQACRERNGASEVLTLLDARMDEVYWAQYRYHDDQNGWQAVIEPTLSGPDAVMPIGQPVACGNGLEAYPASFEALACRRQPEVFPHAAQIAQLARHLLKAGRAVSAREAQPIYLRNKVALTTAERAARVTA